MKKMLKKLSAILFGSNELSYADAGYLAISSCGMMIR